VGYIDGKMVRECDGNLAVGLFLQAILNYNGIASELSRTEDTACGGAEDVTVDVSNQVWFGNNCGADIAVAIHFNSFNENSTGVEVLYTNYPEKNENEIRLANILLEELVSCTGLYNRGLKETPSGVGVIKKVTIPCVLSESAFVSNPGEAIWCYDDYHQFLIAEAHAKAVCRYFDIKFKEFSYEEMNERRLVMVVEQWMIDAGIKAAGELNEKGILNDPEQWKGKMGENTPNWLLFTLLNRVSSSPDASK
jgi:N-acetylmuramoyl-L-alanine amidase